MSVEYKNPTEPVSEQDAVDAANFVEHRLDYLVFDEVPEVAAYQRQEWLQRQDDWRKQIECGDPHLIRSLAEQWRQQQESERQKQQRQLGHIGIEESVAA